MQFQKSITRVVAPFRWKIQFPVSEWVPHLHWCYKCCTTMSTSSPQWALHASNVGDLAHNNVEWSRYFTPPSNALEYNYEEYCKYITAQHTRQDSSMGRPKVTFFAQSPELFAEKSESQPCHRCRAWTHISPYLSPIAFITIHYIWHKYSHTFGTSTVTYLTQVLCHTFSTPGQSKPHNSYFPLFVTNSFCHNPLNLGQILQFHWHPTLIQHMAHCV